MKKNGMEVEHNAHLNTMIFHWWYHIKVWVSYQSFIDVMCWMETILSVPWNPVDNEPGQGSEFWVGTLFIMGSF